MKSLPLRCMVTWRWTPTEPVALWMHVSGCSDWGQSVASRKTRPNEYLIQLDYLSVWFNKACIMKHSASKTQLAAALAPFAGPPVLTPEQPQNKGNTPFLIQYTSKCGCYSLIWFVMTSSSRLTSWLYGSSAAATFEQVTDEHEGVFKATDSRGMTASSMYHYSVTLAAFKPKKCLHVAPHQRFHVWDSWAVPQKSTLILLEAWLFE